MVGPVWCFAFRVLPRPSLLGPVVGCGEDGVLRVWLPVLPCCALLVAVVGSLVAGAPFCGWSGLVLHCAGLGGLLSPPIVVPMVAATPPFFFGAYCWCQMRAAVPLPAVLALSAALWLVVCPFLGGGVGAILPGVVFCLASRWPRGRCGSSLPAGVCRRAGRGGLLVSQPWVFWSLSLFLPGRNLPPLVRYFFAYADLWPLPLLLPPPEVGGFVLVGRGGLFLWPLLAVFCSFIREVSLPPFSFWWGVCLVLHLPSLRRCMHWLANGVTNWTADCAAACCHVVCGHGPCRYSVLLVVYVHAWAGSQSR